MLTDTLEWANTIVLQTFRKPAPRAGATKFAFFLQIGLIKIYLIVSIVPVFENRKKCYSVSLHSNCEGPVLSPVLENKK